MTDEQKPVLDGDDERASVIGWASSYAQAAAIINKHRADTDGLDAHGGVIHPADVRDRTEPVSYDPNVNTREEAEAVERLGAYAPTA